MSLSNDTALFLDLEDPEGTAPVIDAYCVLVETHFNHETQAVVAVCKCWRSREAFEAKKKAFNAIQINLSPKEGGFDFFNQKEHADLIENLKKALLVFCAGSGKLPAKNSLNPELKPDNG
jgi:hypothetical protein